MCSAALEAGDADASKVRLLLVDDYQPSLALLEAVLGT